MTDKELINKYKALKAGHPGNIIFICDDDKCYFFEKDREVVCEALGVQCVGEGYLYFQRQCLKDALNKMQGKKIVVWT